MDRSPYTPGAGHFPPVRTRRVAARLAPSPQRHRLWWSRTSPGHDPFRTSGRGEDRHGQRVRRPGQEARLRGSDLQAVSGHAGLVEALLLRARTRMAEEAGPWQPARQAFERIGGVNLSIAGFGAGISAHQQNSAPGLDAGTLADALATLAAEVRKDTHSGGLLITVDELQVASGPDLALLAATLHRLDVDHTSAAVLFAGTGLPFTPNVLRKRRRDPPGSPLRAGVHPADSRVRRRSLRGSGTSASGRRRVDPRGGRCCGRGQQRLPRPSATVRPRHLDCRGRTSSDRRR